MFPTMCQWIAYRPSRNAWPALRISRFEILAMRLSCPGEWKNSCAPNWLHESLVSPSVEISGSGQSRSSWSPWMMTLRERSATSPRSSIRTPSATTSSLMWWCCSVWLSVQSVGIPESRYVLHPRMSRTSTRVPPSVRPATVATSECEEYGLSKSVVVITILDPTGQSTGSTSETCVSPGNDVAASLVHATRGVPWMSRVQR
mmetsp:Transcript_27262/g.62208  ORF Transcript_27262/g.62208 Transcript_27262/m.62208 type:complete len:202 (+) Transcript_27262:1812-2417(+)